MKKNPRKNRAIETSVFLLYIIIHWIGFELSQCKILDLLFKFDFKNEPKTLSNATLIKNAKLEHSLLELKRFYIKKNFKNIIHQVHYKY